MVCNDSRLFAWLPVVTALACSGCDTSETHPPPGASEHYLHPNAVLDVGGWPAAVAAEQPITGREAAAHAFARLTSRGVQKIEICRADWIAAPVTAHLVDAKGELEIEGQRFTTFRIGIRDGHEEDRGERKAGEDFVFIARGVDPQGKVHWHPEPGPDFEPAKDEITPESLSDYNYLGAPAERRRFERLAEEFR